MPFIPFLTVARAGGQPYGTIANYKVYYANGDFAGLDLYSTFTPGIKNHLAFVVVEDQLAGGNRAAATARTNRGEDYALIVSPEFTPFKGLDLKPMFSWFHADGLTSGAARRSADQHPDRRRRHATSRRPSAVARRPVMRPTRKTATRSAWTRAGVSGRSASTPPSLSSGVSTTRRRSGRTARSGASRVTPRPGCSTSSAATSSARYSSSCGACTARATRRGTTCPWASGTSSRSTSTPGTGAVAGSASSASASTTSTAAAAPTSSMDTNVGYDRYGRGQFALRATYSITPALSVYGVVAPTWSAEKVDTDTGAARHSPWRRAMLAALTGRRRGERS